MSGWGGGWMYIVLTHCWVIFCNFLYETPLGQIKDNKMEDIARFVFQIIFWTVLFNHKHIKEIYYLIKGLTSVQNDR